MLKSKSINMIDGPVFVPIIKYAIPLVIAGILQILFNAADLAVVGNFAGKNATVATAAVGATGAFISLIVQTVMGLANGVNVALSRALGAKDREKTTRIVHTAVLLSLVCGTLVAIIGLLISPYAMEITKCPPEARDRAIIYLRIYFLGCPGIFLYNFGSAILRTNGDTRRPLNFLIVAGISNVVLNFIFVKYCNMDADGVALATSLTQYLAAFLTIRCLMHQYDDTRVYIKRLRIFKEEFIAILRYGLPSGISNAIYSLSNITIQAAVNSYGPSAVAGSSTSSSLEGFVMAGIGAFNSAAMAFGGQNIGARKPERLKKIIASCLLISVSFALILGLGIFLIGDPLYRLYVPKDDAAVAFAGERASIMLTTYFIPAFSGIFSALAQVFGYSFIITAISIFGIFGLRMIWMEFVYPAWQEITTVYMCYPISWGIILVGNIIVFFIAYRNFTKKGILK